MASPNTRILPFGPEAVAEAAELIRRGEPVAVPTETVYGLAADATSEAAVARIYEAKGRPAFNPLIVHIVDRSAAEALGELGRAGRALAEAFWPGPLTLVVPLRPGHGLAPAIAAGLPTIALRCPAHPAMRALLQAGGRPLAAPSANASGTVSPTEATHVLATLDGRIGVILDGGPAQLGLESTIVAIRTDGLALLRPGPIAFEDLLAIAGLAETGAGGGIEAPGQLLGHYAPAKPLRLQASEAQADEWLIGFGQVRGDENLSARGDLAEAAAGLFAALHAADRQSKAKIAVAPIPAEGIGLAINDRLRRAAARNGL